MKKIVLILAGLISVGILLLVIDYMDKESPIKVKISMEGSVFQGAEFIQKKDGQLKLKLASDEAFMSDDGKFMDLKNLTMFFPEKEFTVKAQRGFYYPETGNLTLSGGIEGFSKNYTVYGTEAYWSPKEGTLYSEKPLKIETKKFSINGNSGKANADLVELNKGVVAIVYANKK